MLAIVNRAAALPFEDQGGRYANHMASAWHKQAMGQLTFWWDTTFWPRLERLTDDGYFWEQVSNCWNVRAHPDGGFVVDSQRPPSSRLP